MTVGGSPRVSVIIPTYNRPEYLRQAVESVLAQTYVDFEVIVVDDGSTDNTAEVMATFDDRRVHYIFQQNAKLSAARNRGMKAARGEFIALLDDDDLFLPHKLAAQVTFLDSHPEVGLVAGGTQVITAEGTFVRTVEPWHRAPELTLDVCLDTALLTPSAVIFHRRWLDALDEWFDVEMGRAEDLDFWIRLVWAGCRMAWLPEIVTAYRQHPDSTQQDPDGFHRAYLRLWDKLYTRPDLPGGPRTVRPPYFAGYHIDAARRAYATGEVAVGQQRLREAVGMAPVILEGEPPKLLLRLLSFAEGAGEPVPVALIEAVFDGLPPELAHLRSHRRQVLSRLYMKQLFAARQADRRPRWRDWLLGVYNGPHWLANRGVWAILVRDLVLRSPATGAR